MNNHQSLSLAKTNFRSPQTSGAISLVKTQDNLNQNYIIYRVKLTPIEVSEAGRNLVLKSLNDKKRFVQIGDYTIMINTISSIEPLPVKKKQMHKRLNKTKEKLGIK